MRFIAFDLETTGTVAGVDQIAEIGAVRFIDGAVSEVFVTLIDPGISMPAAAGRVNGLTDEMLAGKPKIADVLESFAEFCGDDMLVAHNAPFDAQFLTADIKRFESQAPRGTIIDTCAMARNVYRGLANYKLGTLVQYFKIPAAGFHRAEADATYCGQVFLEMLKRIAPDGQAPQIERLVQLTGKPALKFPIIEKRPKQLGFLDMGF